MRLRFTALSLVLVLASFLGACQSGEVTPPEETPAGSEQGELGGTEEPTPGTEGVEAAPDPDALGESPTPGGAEEAPAPGGAEEAPTPGGVEESPSPSES